MIASDTLARIADRVSAIGCDESSLPTLRDEFDPVHFSYCMDDDVVGPGPAYSGAGFNLYLIDACEHCLKLTSSLDSATGVLLAEVIEDEED